MIIQKTFNSIFRCHAIKCPCPKKLAWKSFLDTILQSRSVHCKYIQRKDSGSAVKPLWFWKNTVVYHRPCFTVFFTSKNCNFSIILHVMLILLVFTAFKSTTKKTVKMALKNCKNGAKKLQTLKAIIKSDLQNMRIVFWRSLLKIKLKNLQIF